ncbi:MAG TPA: flagellar basal body rod protein FlgC [Magnetospirillaceae bacterium]|jgi:flagellar basal-body rod protein FlgC
MDELNKASEIAVSGMKVQAERLRVVSENLANADSLPTAPDQQPYRRKIISFRNVLDKSIGADTVRVAKVDVDRSQFNKVYQPNHPAADAAGYVLAPNVNSLVELMDMREAERSYQANMDVVTTSRAMLSNTINMLK